MSEMVERVARVMRAKSFLDLPNMENEIERFWRRWEPTARAAIAAMRELTEAMVKTGSENVKMVLDYEDAKCAAEEVWPAMIEEALRCSGS